MAEINNKKVTLISLSSNLELAKKISEISKIPLSECKVERFADGEINVNLQESVRGSHVFIVQPTCSPVNENIMELLITIDAVKRASARSINCIMPYYGYSRQDRKARSRQPISARLVADLIETAGATRVIAVDLHAAQIQGFFSIPNDNFQGLPILAEYFIENDIENVVVVSPDHGGATRARNLAEILNCPIAIIDKRRPEPNKAEVQNIVGDVKGKNCIMVDDMIDTAGSITAGARALREAGALDIYAAATHPLFNGPAIERLNNSPIKKVIVTDSVPLSKEKVSDKVIVVSLAKTLSRGILRIIHDKGLSDLFVHDSLKN